TGLAGAGRRLLQNRGIRFPPRPQFRDRTQIEYHGCFGGGIGTAVSCRIFQTPPSRINHREPAMVHFALFATSVCVTLASSGAPLPRCRRGCRCCAGVAVVPPQASPRDPWYAPRRIQILLDWSLCRQSYLEQPLKGRRMATLGVSTDVGCKEQPIGSANRKGALVPQSGKELHHVGIGD